MCGEPGRKCQPRHSNTPLRASVVMRILGTTHHFPRILRPRQSLAKGAVTR